MAHDFYLKAQALHEEFQKRELHYLNTERKLNSSIMGKKNLNLPLQEYLQKINQREKETDEMYRNIMKQMEELDQHTDIMSLKLEKLGILRTNVISTTTPSQFQKLEPNVGSNYQSFGTHSLYTAPNILPLSVKSVSTQTENNMYCRRCKSTILISDEPDHLLENLPPSSSSYFGMNDKTETTQSYNSQYNSSTVLNEPCDISQYVESRNKKHLLLTRNHKNLLQKNSETDHTQAEKSPEQELSFSMELNESKNNSLENQLQPSKCSVAENIHVSKNNERLTVPVTKGKCDETQVVDSESNMDILVSKSDVESMNNEFDFLESDTANMPSKTEIQQSSRNIKSSTKYPNVSIDKAPTLTEEHSVKPKLNSKNKEQEKNALHPNFNLNAGDDKSETSGSVSGIHSSNVSVASDSESVSEKGYPQTASAAYQALLGNPTHLGKTPQNISDSESEDEVEIALASAVQRSHVKSKSSVKQKKDETFYQQADAKPADKPTKLSSVNKPKLSKNTRKVLGLDTSSGSEVEMALKLPSGKKIEEDSDEFDFYN